MIISTMPRFNYFTPRGQTKKMYVNQSASFCGLGDGTVNQQSFEEKLHIKLKNIKLKDGKSRLDDEEINNIIDASTPKNQELLESLLAAKSTSGSNRFDGKEISYILWAFEPKMQEVLDELLAIKSTDGNDRFNGDEVSLILGKYKLENKENLNALLAAKSTDGANRFNGKEIIYILSCLRPENKEHLNLILNAKPADGFNYKDIGIVLYRCNPDNKKHLVSILSTGSNRFKSNKIWDILYCCRKENKEQLDMLLAAKTTDGNFRFNDNEIYDIFNKCTPENKEQLDMLLAAKTTDGGFRFNYNEIEEIIIRSTSKNKKYLAKLIDSKDGNKLKYSATNLARIFTILSSFDMGFLLKDSYNELNLNDKKSLLMNLSSYKDSWVKNINRLRERGLEKEWINEIVEKKPEDLFRKVIKSIKNSVKTKPLSEDTRAVFFNALVSIDKSIKNLDFDKSEFKLDYPRINFITDLSNNLQGLTLEQKRDVFNYYNFNLDDNKKLTGYPVVLDKQDESVKDPDISEERKNAIEKTIKDFTIYNKISIVNRNTKKQSIQNKELEDNLNAIIKALPEFLTSVGKKQHATQKYTLDMHQLKVLKEFIIHPDYNKLSDNDKKIGKLAILIHDIAKKEDEVDKAHPINSSVDAYSIIKKFNLPAFEFDRIIALIKNHHWSEELANSKKSAEDVAFEFRKPGDFEISKIFAEADLKSINDNFQNRIVPNTNKTFGQNLKDNIKKVQLLVDDLHSTGIWLPRTLLPKASKVENPKYVSEVKGITNGKLKVIDMQDFDEFYGIIHAINSSDDDNFTKEKADMFSYIEDEDNEGVLSTSFVTNKNFNTFNNRAYGFVLNVDPSNIAAFDKESMISGYKKGLKDFRSYLFDKNTTYILRNNFSSILKSKLNMNKANYKNLYKDLSQKQNLEDVNISNISNTACAISDTLKEFVGDYHNELVTYAGKVMGVFAKGKENIDKKLNDMPQGLKEYAVEHDLPVLNVTV